MPELAGSGGVEVDATWLSRIVLKNYCGGEHRRRENCINL
jgi:hypothetical protein